jgi:hypothetical protein
MTIPQQIRKTRGGDRSCLFRMRALFCEQRADQTSEHASKQEWQELAIEWHTTANLALVHGEKSPHAAVSFGIDDMPVCTECNNSMRITRRSPHPTYGLNFEFQTFACRVCRYEINRSADIAGEVI